MTKKQGHSKADRTKMLPEERRKRLGEPSVVSELCEELDIKPGRPRSGVRPNPITSCTHIYTEEEEQFIRAVEAYKKRTRRKFPTLSEFLAILKSLGYTRGP